MGNEVSQWQTYSVTFDVRTACPLSGQEPTTLDPCRKSAYDPGWCENAVLLL
jgi:hypothetical protein